MPFAQVPVVVGVEVVVGVVAVVAGVAAGVDVDVVEQEPATQVREASFHIVPDPQFSR